MIFGFPDFWSISYKRKSDLVAADAKGIIRAIDFSFKSISFENWSSKLVGYGFDAVSIVVKKKA